MQSREGERNSGGGELPGDRCVSDRQRNQAEAEWAGAAVGELGNPDSTMGWAVTRVPAAPTTL